jgi:hypothetical protein
MALTVTLILIASFFWLVWLAVLICAGLDRLLGRPDAVYVSVDEPIKKRKPFTVWQRILLVPLAILVVPPVIVFLIPVLTLFGLAKLFQWGFFRGRLMLFGIPRPSLSE